MKICHHRSYRLRYRVDLPRMITHSRIGTLIQ